MCSALCQVWSDTELLFSSKDIDSSTLSEAEYRRMEVKMTECLKLGEVDEYNKPHRVRSVWLLANYRRKTFKAHDLKNIRAFTDSPGDPLVRCDKAGFAAAKQVADPVYRYDPELNEYKKVDKDPDIQDYKQYNRRHLLYCVGESAACNFVMGGTAEKPVGLVHIAVAGPDCCASQPIRLGESRGRDWVRTVSTGEALNRLRLRLMEAG